jgi:hypothetical protein
LDLTNQHDATRFTTPRATIQVDSADFRAPQPNVSTLDLTNQLDAYGYETTTTKTLARLTSPAELVPPLL